MLVVVVVCFLRRTFSKGRQVEVLLASLLLPLLLFSLARQLALQWQQEFERFLLLLPDIVVLDAVVGASVGGCERSSVLGVFVH